MEKELVDWKELSYYITNDRDKITKNNIPKEHKQRVSFLLALIKCFLNNAVENKERDLFETGFLYASEKNALDFVGDIFEARQKGIKEGIQLEKERIKSLL